MILKPYDKKNIHEDMYLLEKKDNNIAYITCPKHLCFTNAVPFVKNRENHLTVLGYDKGSSNQSFLEQYKIPDF